MLGQVMLDTLDTGSADLKTGDMQGVQMADYVNGQIVREDLSGQKSREDTPQTGRRFCGVFLLSFGLLCILQAALNVSLRLTLHSGQVRLDCNATHSTGNTVQIDCEQLKTRIKNMTARCSFNGLTTENNKLEDSVKTPDCNGLQERFNDLTRERDQLRNRISQLNNMKRQLEEERDRLTKMLTEGVQSGCVSGQRCPAGWEEINTRCYLFSSEKRTWQDSREACQGKAADLVVINSSQEQRSLSRLNGDADHFWIGLSDRERPGTFKWVDGSALTTSTSFWQPGKPGKPKPGRPGPGPGPNNREECVEVNLRRPVQDSWNNAPCERRQRWLCERDLCAAAVLQSTGPYY